MKAKELKIGIVLGLVLLLGLDDLSEATTIEEDWWNNSSILCDNSNSMIIDNVEYYMQTDKSVYELGENVNMTYRVTNLRDENVTFRFPHYPIWNFWVDKDGSNIYRVINLWYTVITNLTLTPGEYKNFTCIWDMKNKQGELVNVGNYIDTGGLYAGTGAYDFTRVSVDIVVVPEPSSIALLMFGLLGVMSKKKVRNTII